MERGRTGGFPPRAALAALAAAALAGAFLPLSGCARPRRPAAVAYPYSAASQKNFYATGSGLSETASEAAAGTEEPASSAPNASVLSSDGTQIAAAINGWGLERILSSPDGASYRIADEPRRAAFAGLCTAGAWPMGGGFLVQLFRDPFADSGEASDPPPDVGSRVPAAQVTASRLAYFGFAADAKGAAVEAPDPFKAVALPGFEQFALLPAGGTWFAELRKDSPDRVDFKFYALADPLSPSPALREISRGEFKAALMPLPLSSLPREAGEALRSALGALGTGPWLARLRTAKGEDRWYLSAGRPEEAMSAFAWDSGGGSAGGKVLVLSPDGRLASCAPSCPPSITRLALPVEGASFTALAAAGGIAAAAWEAGDFPYISSAGLVVASVQ
jgi:hypothetical protein